MSNDNTTSTEDTTLDHDTNADDSDDEATEGAAASPGGETSADGKKKRPRVDLPSADMIRDFLKEDVLEEMTQYVKNFQEVNTKGVSQEELAKEFFGDSRAARIVAFALQKYPTIGKSYLGANGGVYPPGTEPVKGAEPVTRVEVSEETVAEVRRLILRSLKNNVKPTVNGIFQIFADRADMAGTEMTVTLSQITSAVHHNLPEFASVQGGIRKATPDDLADRAKKAAEAAAKQAAKQA